MYLFSSGKPAAWAAVKVAQEALLACFYLTPCPLSPGGEGSKAVAQASSPA